MKVSKLAPVIAVENVAATVEFYSQYLDFKLGFAVPDDNAIETTIDPNKSYRYAMLQNNGIEIAFQRLDTFEPIMELVENQTIGASVAFYMDIENIDTFYQEMKLKNLKITELTTTWYGVKEFYMKDINGYILGFAEQTQ